MKLSENFNLAEFTKSQTAIRKGIKNKPGRKEIHNLKLLCKNILQPLRDSFGLVIINSGYRSPELNKAIGGSIHSQHCLGQAADIEIPEINNLDLACDIQEAGNFDQLILEYHDEEEPSSGWVHISYKQKGNRNIVMRAVKRGKKTVYLKGLGYD